MADTVIPSSRQAGPQHSISKPTPYVFLSHLYLVFVAPFANFISFSSLFFFFLKTVVKYSLEQTGEKTQINK